VDALYKSTFTLLYLLLLLLLRLLLHLLLRYMYNLCIVDWRWTADDESGFVHRQIISYFGDTSSPQSPFSIQKLISIGRESGRKAGDWYGPASIANALW